MTIIALCMFTMIIHIKGAQGLEENCRRWLMITSFSILAGTVCDCLGTVLDGEAKLQGLLMLMTLLEFSSVPAIPAFVAAAFELKSAAKARAAAAVHSAIELLMMPAGMVFYYTDGLYHRGPLYGMYICAYALGAIYMLFIGINMSRRFKKRNVFTLVLSLVILAGGIIPSLININVRTSFLGVSMCAVILYIYYKDLADQDLIKSIEEKSARIESIQKNTIEGMACLIESRDRSTGEHVKRTAMLVEMLANKAKEEGLYSDILTDEYIDILIKTAPLHDTGKIVVPDDILNKPGRLSNEEYEIMKKHTTEGGRIVKELLNGVADEEYIKTAWEIVEFHHERWDGKGYPMGLKGEEIPVNACIMAIADVYEALTSKRVYKDAYPKELALKMIDEGSGTQFNPALAHLFCRIMK